MAPANELSSGDTVTGPVDDAPAAPLVLKSTQLLGAAAFACIAKYLPVYFASIGLERNLIGLLTFTGMGVTFVGQQFWSAIIDWLKDFKSVLVATQIAAVITLFFYTVQTVQEAVVLIFTVSITNTFLSSTGGTIIDALCMATLEAWKDREKRFIQANNTVTPRTVAGSQVSYGDTRLWSAVGWGGMSLLMGVLIDAYGMPAMFGGFACIQATNVFIVVFFLRSPKREEVAVSTPVAGASEATGCAKYKSVCSFNAGLFFSNLMIYGICMCLIENFLFVFLVQEFEPKPSNFLLGGSTTVMCIFEIPVFMCLGPWLEKAPDGAFTVVLLVCQIITALRCVLYAVMPRNMAWLAVVVGCLQGVSFAAMWTASMEYAKRLATKDTLATMTSLTGGIYYSLSMGFGSLLWGVLVDTNTGIGFTKSFYLDAVIMMVWSAIWLTGVFYGKKRSSEANSQREALTAS